MPGAPAGKRTEPALFDGNRRLFFLKVPLVGFGLGIQAIGWNLVTHRGNKVFKMLLAKGKITRELTKDGRTSKSFPALEWLAAMSSHIPNRGEQMVRYYGYYSNVSRGKRQKEGRDDIIPCILEPQGDEKIFRRNWARLIQKIYEVDPMVCPKCQGHHAGHQQHRRPVGDPGHPRSPGHLAHQVKAAAENP